MAAMAASTPRKVRTSPCFMPKSAASTLSWIGSSFTATLEGGRGRAMDKAVPVVMTIVILGDLDGVLDD